MKRQSKVQVPKKPLFIVSTIAASVLFPILTFVGGMATSGFQIAKNIATVQYVDDGLASGRKYSDDKDEIVRREAFEHSDRNRLEMTNQMTGVSTKVEVATGKLDLLIQSLDRIEKQRNEDAKIEVLRNQYRTRR